MSHPHTITGPFISYVREDDDYDSVVARFAVITGEPESEWKNYRLAVVHNKTPFFIPRGVVGATGGALSMLTSAMMMMDDNDCVAANAAMEIVPDINGGLDAIGMDDSQLRSSSAWSAQGQSSMNKKKIPTVWEKLLEKFDYETAVDPDKPCPNNFRNDANDNDNDKCHFPMIGIQRSVAATNGFTTRTKGRRIASAIKISG